MTAEETTALHAERDGMTSYFCSEHCPEKLVSTHADGKPDKYG
jgi:YHS domain-containing protein